MMKKIALAMALAVVLGCSSLSEVIAHNDGAEPIQLRVTDGVKPDWSGSIPPGASASVWRGFGGPEKLVFAVNGQTITYDGRTMPVALAEAGSGGTDADWVWNGARATFTADPVSRIDHWFRGVLITSTLGLFVLIALVGLVMKRFNAKSARVEPEDQG